MVNEVSSYAQVQAPVRTVTAAVDSNKTAKSTSEVKSTDELERGQKLTRQEPAQDKLAPPASGTDTESEKLSLPEVMNQMKDYVQNIERDLEFSIDEESGRTIITVIDSETDEIIRQIPPEELLHVVKALQQNSASLFVEAKV